MGTVVFHQDYFTGERHRPKGKKGAWRRETVREWFMDCQDCSTCEGPFATREEAETAQAGHRC